MGSNPITVNLKTIKLSDKKFFDFSNKTFANLSHKLLLIYQMEIANLSNKRFYFILFILLIKDFIKRFYVTIVLIISKETSDLVCKF